MSSTRAVGCTDILVTAPISTSVRGIFHEQPKPFGDVGKVRFRGGHPDDELVELGVADAEDIDAVEPEEHPGCQPTETLLPCTSG